MSKRETLAMRKALRAERVRAEKRAAKGEIGSEDVRAAILEVEELYRARTEKTAMDYVVVASADQEDDLETNEAEVRAWYDAHQEDYRRSAGRKIR